MNRMTANKTNCNSVLPSPLRGEGKSEGELIVIARNPPKAETKQSHFLFNIFVIDLQYSQGAV